MIKNKKGEVNEVGAFIMVALALIVGLILLTASAQNVAQATQTLNVSNRSLGAISWATSASNTTGIYLTDMKDITDVVIWNATTQVVAAGNYTITADNVYNGGLAVRVVAVNTSQYANWTWYISGTGLPTTYDSNSGGRAVAGIIIIFAAIAVAVVALTPTLRSKVLDYV